MEIEKPQCMVIDASVIKEMIEDNNSTKAVECMKMLKKLEENPKFKDKLWVVTPTSCLLRAIYLADEKKFKLQNLQKIISFATVLPSFADFRNEEAVIKEILSYAKQFSGEKKNGDDGSTN